MRFIVNITEYDLIALKNGEQVITKMLLTPDDFSVFHYTEGDDIEAETPDGNRMSTIISHLETLKDDHRVIVILSLINQQ